MVGNIFLRLFNTYGYLMTILGELGQYYGCSYPGSIRRRDIRTHGIATQHKKIIVSH